ncbi:hydantoinase/oxoprolinase family protein [Rhizorhabdus wittichii]|uniref:hydantoinase/oxoprolinase family protein n=1 Tax=Rhizorhabdus wittichii TaxID=160791 RepID=UPI000378BFD3|nr:hydantoinase/oxoprolinase family protein [Rhizorhabdus wittichii]
MKFIGVDVGGTFTDIVLTDTASNETFTHKVSSTPADPSIAVMRGILEICEMQAVDPSSIDHVFHGTTVATNAALEGKGVTTGLITTKGFRDILHIGRHQRPQHYSIQQNIPWQSSALIERRFRKVVTERIIPPKGAIETALDEDEVRQAARELVADGVKAICICFLFSYLNPAHELRAKEIVEDECPDIFVTTSYEVSPLYREFERFTTTAMNGYIGPRVRDYVNRLQSAVADIGERAGLRIMRSNGGLATPELVSKLPVCTLMSGLAAGVLGGTWIGKLSGRGNLITFDIGGTSADIGVVTQGQVAEANPRDSYVAGFPIMIPMMDLHTIGAGGGSIAYVDEASGFKVGPQSAGAEPGPAAYGRGGTLATVTDANIVLGRLDKDRFLGGAMALDAAAAERVVGELAATLKMDPVELAEGIVTVLNANMANAIRSMTVQKGIDPRDYALLASGGGGPLHGAEVARQLGIREVIVPPFPGINSAIGLLTTDLKYDVVRTSFALSTEMNFVRMNDDLSEMEAQMQAQLDVDHVAAENRRFERFADLRYLGQGYELRVELPAREFSAEVLAEVVDLFHAAHQKEYGHCFRDAPVEFVNIRLIGIGKIANIGGLPEPEAIAPGSSFLKTDKAVFRVDGKLETLDTQFHERDRIAADEVISGPAVILQKDTTIVVPPRCEFVHLNGNIGLITVDVA